MGSEGRNWRRGVGPDLFDHPVYVRRIAGCALKKAYLAHNSIRGILLPGRPITYLTHFSDIAMELNDEIAVMIKCPNSGKPVMTGLSMSKGSFQKALIGTHEVRCPHCGQVHMWSKKDAHLAGEPPQKGSGPNVPT